MDTEVSKNHGGQENVGPMAELANEPSFEERKKSFAEAKRAGELPEGVRDEQDYREYMAEKVAHDTELAKDKTEILKSIETLKDPYDKDLAISFVPFVLNRDFNEKLSNGQSYEILSGIVNHLQSGSDETVRDYLRNCSKRANEAGDLQMVHSLAGYCDIAETLDFGNRVEREEANSDYFELSYDNDNYFFREDFSRKSHETRKVAIAWAKEIAKTDDESTTLLEREKNHFVISTLSEVVRIGDAERVLDWGLNRCIEELRRNVRDEVRRSGDPRQGKIDLWNSGILGVVWSDDVKRDFKSRCLDHESYKRYLQEGKELIGHEAE